MAAVSVDAAGWVPAGTEPITVAAVDPAGRLLAAATTYAAPDQPGTVIVPWPRHAHHLTAYWTPAPSPQAMADWVSSGPFLFEGAMRGVLPVATRRRRADRDSVGVAPSVRRCVPGREICSVPDVAGRVPPPALLVRAVG